MLKVQNHVKHFYSMVDHLCANIARTFYVVVVFYVYYPKKGRKNFLCVCICRCSARMGTETIQTCIFIFIAGREAFLLFLLGIFSWLYFAFNTIQLSSKCFLHRICDWIILLSVISVMMIEYASECGLVTHKICWHE